MDMKMQLLPLALQFFFFFGVYRCLMRVAYWSIRSKHFFFFLKEKGVILMCSVYILCTRFSLLITADASACSLVEWKAECFDGSGKQWLFDVSISRSPTLTRRCEDEAGRSGWAQSKVFLNGIRLKVVFLVEWISNCVCLHTQAGCWNWQGRQLGWKYVLAYWHTG